MNHWKLDWKNDRGIFIRTYERKSVEKIIESEWNEMREKNIFSTAISVFSFTFIDFLSFL